MILSGCDPLDTGGAPSVNIWHNPLSRVGPKRYGERTWDSHMSTSGGNGLLIPHWRKIMEYCMITMLSIILMTVGVITWFIAK